MLALVPEFFVRFILWPLTHTVYRIRVVGQDHVPFRGPALLVCNHLSHVDGLLIGASRAALRPVHRLAALLRAAALQPALRLMHAIPVSASRHDVVASLDKARRAELEAGHVVCIFAEGAISRTGNLLPFKRGFERIVAGPRRAGHPGEPGSGLGQHLQLQARDGSSGSGPSACRIP